MSKPDAQAPEAPAPEIGPRRFKADAASRLGIREPEDVAEGRAEIVRNIARARHKVRIDGKDENLTVAELLLVKLRNLAASGNPRATRAYNKYLERYAPRVTEEGAYLVAPAAQTPEEWARSTEELDRKADARRAEELRREQLFQRDGQDQGS